MSLGLSRTLIPVASALVLLGLAAPAGGADESPTLELALVRQAPALIRHLKVNRCATVGVLKFLVAREGRKGLGDSAGTLNALLARRLEVALVLANDQRAPVGILRHASAVAARTPGATHRSKEGREKLFAAAYPLAWGETQVKADAFVTGIAEVSKDLRALKVTLIAFQRGTNKPVQVGEDLVARLDPGKLVEIGESYLLRDPSAQDAIRKAAEVKEGKAAHPLAVPAPPVRLEVLYDGKPTRITHRGGQAFVAEPKVGQKVTFRLSRDATSTRYGVVLKVLGESCVGRQRQPDLECRRFLFDPGSRPATIDGYSIDGRATEAFRLRARRESAPGEVFYGDEVGTITLAVYRERRKEEQFDLNEPAEVRHARVVARAVLPQADSYPRLKYRLLEADEELRGRHSQARLPFRAHGFRPEAIPVMCATVIVFPP
jgi:hypothetical protein